jgi:hypothetical protein
MKMENKSNSIFLILMASIAIVSVLQAAGSASAVVHEENLTSPENQPRIIHPNFIVQSLKYEPYPVNPGDSFDIWIKADNLGQDDAPQVQFELLPEYPFSAEGDQVQKFGIIRGTVTATNNKLPDEQVAQENQVVLKYRVQVAENAEEGTQMLKLSVLFNSDNNTRRIFYLPITIAKTKTSFDLVLQNPDARRAIFAISNIGDKTGTAVSVNIKESSLISGASSIPIGNMAPGDFTTLGFQFLPEKAAQVEQVTLQVAYTDSAGNRVVTDKIIPVKLAVEPNGSSAAAKSQEAPKGLLASYGPWIYGIGGFILGALIAGAIFRKRGKRRRDD